jgi:predicted ribosomally synthesized peptide with SipW-like signal peptide
MKTVYEAANGLEAHMLCDLMQQEGITAFVRGAALQGAMGELPAAGLVRIEVAEADFARGRTLVEQWEAREAPPASASSAKTERHGSRFLPGLLLGLALGALGIGGTWAYFQSSARIDCAPPHEVSSTRPR